MHYKKYAIRAYNNETGIEQFIEDYSARQNGCDFGIADTIQEAHWFKHEGGANAAVDVLVKLYQSIGEHNYDFTVVEITVDYQNE